METIIHDVVKISFDEVENEGSYCHRRIFIKTTKGEELELSLFAKTEEDLKVNIKEIKLV